MFRSFLLQKKSSKFYELTTFSLLLYNYIIIRNLQIYNDLLEHIYFYLRTTLVAPAPPSS